LNIKNEKIILFISEFHELYGNMEKEFGENKKDILDQVYTRIIDLTFKEIYIDLLLVLVKLHEIDVDAVVFEKFI
jgi:hypothetical protein